MNKKENENTAVSTENSNEKSSNDTQLNTKIEKEVKEEKEKTVKSDQLVVSSKKEFVPLGEDINKKEEKNVDFFFNSYCTYLFDTFIFFNFYCL